MSLNKCHKLKQWHEFKDLETQRQGIPPARGVISAGTWTTDGKTSSTNTSFVLSSTTPRASLPQIVNELSEWRPRLISNVFAEPMR
jgi:hypothetical protein